MDEKQYSDYVKQVTPTTNTFRNVVRAFITGGLICTLGQVIYNLFEYSGMEADTAGSWTTISLILLSVILTGFHLFHPIVKWGGAGALVPVTGFANSVAAPAIEFKNEGQVFGIGCKIFTIAGPVILFGLLTSWVGGIIYLILLRMGVM